MKDREREETAKLIIEELRLAWPAPRLLSHMWLFNTSTVASVAQVLCPRCFASQYSEWYRFIGENKKHHQVGLKPSYRPSPVFSCLFYFWNARIWLLLNFTDMKFLIFCFLGLGNLVTHPFQIWLFLPSSICLNDQLVNFPFWCNRWIWQAVPIFDFSCKLWPKSTKRKMETKKA